MDTSKYIKTFVINSREVKLGLDDYSQCYFIEWEDETGKINDTGLGTYNFRYMEDIYYLFDPVYKILARKDLKGEPMTDEEKVIWKEYRDMFAAEYQKYGEEEF